MKRILPTLALAFVAQAHAETTQTPDTAGRVAGDTLKIYVSEQAREHSLTLPERGLGIAAVRQRYGEPASVQSAPGTPPISVWRYAEFTVYFERDSVIHAVRHHKPGD